jgi:hypothetical protein
MFFFAVFYYFDGFLCVNAFLYERFEISASYTSAIAMIRPNKGISSSFNPFG